MTEPTLILVRGHPGSGKTTYAQHQVAQAPESTVHLENDQFFTAPDGTYAFDFAQHQEAKDWCLSATLSALQSGQSVVVSNTFTTRAELTPYLALGYPVSVVEMGLEFANVHHVPEAVVTAKKAQFEPFEGALVISSLADATLEPAPRKAKPRF